MKLFAYGMTPDITAARLAGTDQELSVSLNMEFRIQYQSEVDILSPDIVNEAMVSMLQNLNQFGLTSTSTL